MTTVPLDLLLGADARALLQTALDGYGGRLHAVAVRTVGVQPSGAAVVQYTAEVERADGLRTREILAATTGSRIPDGAAVVTGTVDGRDATVGLWRWPQDPALPALATAADPARLADALRALGLPRAGTPRVAVRAYRPGRRAVLRVTGGGDPLYVKVVRPGAVDALVARHRLLAPHLPVPPVLGATPDGLVVLPEMPGTPMRAQLGRAPLPPAAVDDVLDALPAALLDLPGRARPGHLDRIAHFAAVLRRTAGPSARLDELVATLTAADPGDHTTVAVHGDLHDAQLLTDAGRVTGLLDVDTAGRGHRIDEWATLLAHLSVQGGSASRYGAELLAHAERRLPRPQLRARVAAAVLGLATGPFRVQQPGWAGHTRDRLRLAARWASGV